jgi:phosphatidylinositol-3-phosphatase
MKRSLAVRNFMSIISGAGLFVVACTDQVSAPTGEGTPASVTERVSEAHTFCGNRRCDHGETCSTCPQDCGTCGGTGGSGGSAGTTGSGGSAGTTGSAGATGTGGSGGSTGVCGSTAAPPTHYQHVVIFSFENRTWSNVGLGFSASTMPYMHSLAAQCSYFSDWTETNTQQNSLTQYIGETSGVDNPSTVNDCNPSTSCQSVDNNIFRQVRVAGGTARNYVEGATTGCSASGNAAKHVPGLYYFGTYTDGTGSHNDHDFCNTEVRPYSEFDPNNLPTYAFITPTLCNDGHDCGDATVDAWAATNIQRVLDSAAYKSGNTAVFVWYDEDHPVPNMTVVPTSHMGQMGGTGVGSHAALLKTIEDLLGVPFMNQGQLPGATDLRSVLGI